MVRYRAWTLGVFVIGAVVVALGLAETLIYTAAGELVPALQSYWLAIHVTAMTLATGIFFVAFVLGVVYLAVDRYTRRVAAGRAWPGNAIIAQAAEHGAARPARLPDVVFGFPVWTFSVIAGAIWADQAWGGTGAGTRWRPGPSSPGSSTPRSCTPGPPPAGAAGVPTTSSCSASPA